MASLRDIRVRIESVKNTKKITYAMKLVAAAKLKRAQDAAQRGRVYTDQLNQMVAALVQELGSDGIKSPYLKPADSKSDGTGARCLLVVFGGARGLCGGYNSNLNKQLEASIKELSATREVELMIIGKKPGEYLRRTGRTAVKSFEDVPEDATQWPIDAIAQEIEERFTSGAVSEVYFLYTKFRSAISMTPTVSKLLPMDPSSLAGGVTQSSGEGAGVANGALSNGALSNGAVGLTLFEPSPAQVFSELLPRLMRSKLRQGASDAKASETAARMTAMDAATKNAGDLINKLTLLRNKLRQSGITSQLLDIVGGAEAVNS